MYLDPRTSANYELKRLRRDARLALEVGDHELVDHLAQEIRRVEQQRDNDPACKLRTRS